MAFNINQLNFDYQNGLSQITLQATDGTETIINITVPVQASPGSAATPAQIKQAAIAALQGAIETLSATATEPFAIGKSAIGGPDPIG